MSYEDKIGERVKIVYEDPEQGVQTVHGELVDVQEDHLEVKFTRGSREGKSTWVGRSYLVRGDQL